MLRIKKTRLIRSPALLGPFSSDSDEEETEEPVVTITINGPHPSAVEAQSILRDLIGERVSRTRTRITDIPAAFFPFISVEADKITESVGAGREVRINIPPPAILKAFKAQAEAALDGSVENGWENSNGTNGEGNKGRKDKDLSIIVNGEKSAVAEVVEAINSLYEQLVCVQFYVLILSVLCPRLKLGRRTQ